MMGINFSVSKDTLWQKEIIDSYQNGSLNDEDASMQIEEMVVDYSKNSSEIDSLTNFVQQILERNDVKIDPVTNEIGWSGNSVFKVSDSKTKEIQLFLKIFDKENMKILPELFGINYLQKVEAIATQKIEALGKFYLNERCYFILAETPVNGHSFQYYYNEIGKQPIDSDLRNEFFRTLLRASYLSGVALASLHMSAKFEYLPFSEDIEKDIRGDLIRAKLKLEKSPRSGVEINLLEKLVEMSIEKMKSEKHIRGVAHNDFKLIHTFYDPRDEQISFIGSKHLINSFKTDGALKGMPAKDYFYFIRSLYLNRFGYSLDTESKSYKQELLTSDEALEIIYAFQDGYQAAGGLPLSEIEKEFLLISHHLMFIGNLDRILPEPDQTRLKDLCEISLDSVKQLIIHNVHTDNTQDRKGY